MSDWADTSGIVEVVVKGQAQSQAINNVFHLATMSSPSAPNTSTLAVLAPAFIAKWQSQIIPFATTNYSVQSYNFSVITGRTANPRPQPNPIGNWTPNLLSYGAQKVVLGVSADVGTYTGAPLCTFQAAAIRWVPGLKFRWARTGNRFYVGNEADTTNNSWNSSNAFIANFGTSVVTVLLGGFTCNSGGDKAFIVAFGKRTFLRAGGSPVPYTFTSYAQSGLLNPFVSSQVSRKQRQRLQ